MAEIVRQSVIDGAMGFSSSRTIAHRTIAGEHIPTLTAAGDELTSIARAMGETGKGLVQLVTDFTDAEAEFDLLRHIAVASGRPVSFALIQNADRPLVYRQVLDLLSNATAEGLSITAQVPVRGVGLVMGLDTSLNPFSRNSVYTPFSNEPVGRQLAIMRQDGFRERLVEAQIALHESGRTIGRLIYSYERLFELSDPPNYEPAPREQHCCPRRAARECTRQSSSTRSCRKGMAKTCSTRYISNLVPGDLDIVRELLGPPRHRRRPQRCRSPCRHHRGRQLSHNPVDPLGQGPRLRTDPVATPSADADSRYGAACWALRSRPAPGGKACRHQRHRHGRSHHTAPDNAA